jgi:hypothetical protein
LDVVVDQLVAQGRTVRRIPADNFSDLFNSASSSPASDLPSRPSSSSSSSTTSIFIPGILSSHAHLISPVPSYSGISQLVIPSTIVIPPAPSPKNQMPLTVNTNNNMQSDADIINELANTEHFNKYAI